MHRWKIAAAFGLALMATPVVAEDVLVRVDIDGLTAAADPAASPPLRKAVYKRNGLSANRNPMLDRLAPQGPYWPERAQRMGVSGGVVLQCVVAAKGVLNDCTTVFQTPVGWFFADASLLMAQRRHLTVEPSPDAKDGDLGRVLVLFKNPDARIAKPAKE